jgi:hypothetical protein
MFTCIRMMRPEVSHANLSSHVPAAGQHVIPRTPQHVHCWHNHLSGTAIHHALCTLVRIEHDRAVVTWCCRLIDPKNSRRYDDCLKYSVVASKKALRQVRSPTHATLTRSGPGWLTCAPCLHSAHLLEPAPRSAPCARLCPHRLALRRRPTLRATPSWTPPVWACWWALVWVASPCSRTVGAGWVALSRARACVDRPLTTCHAAVTAMSMQHTLLCHLPWMRQSVSVCRLVLACS